MMIGGHLYGGAPILRKYKIGASFSNAGIVTINGPIGYLPPTTTDMQDTTGLAVDTGTYSTTQGDAEGFVTVAIRPDTIVRALMTGGATEGTALVVLSNTIASTSGTLVTDTVNVPSGVDFTSGTIWGLAGANVAQSRSIVSNVSATSMTVTVPFLNDIAVGDTFLYCAYGVVGTGTGGLDGLANLQTTTLFTQANANAASGAGATVTIADLELNGRADSFVSFVLYEHVYHRTSA